MGEAMRESINSPKFGQLDSEKYWWHHAFIFRSSSNVHPALHMGIVTTPSRKANSATPDWMSPISRARCL